MRYSGTAFRLAQSSLAAPFYFAAQTREPPACKAVAYKIIRLSLTVQTGRPGLRFSTAPTCV